MGSDPVLEGLLKRSRPYVTDVLLRNEIDRYLAGDGTPTWEVNDKGIYYCFFSGIGLKVSRDFTGCRWEIGTMLVNPNVTVVKVFLTGVEQGLEDAQEKAINAARFITVQRGRKDEDPVPSSDRRANLQGSSQQANAVRKNHPGPSVGVSARPPVHAPSPRPRGRPTGS
jgi:hypothetical protein